MYVRVTPTSAQNMFSSSIKTLICRGFIKKVFWFKNDIIVVTLDFFTIVDTQLSKCQQNWVFSSEHLSCFKLNSNPPLYSFLDEWRPFWNHFKKNFIIYWKSSKKTPLDITIWIQCEPPEIAIWQSKNCQKLDICQKNWQKISFLSKKLPMAALPT